MLPEDEQILSKIIRLFLIDVYITICITYFGYQVSSKDFVTGCCVLMSLMKVMMTMKMMMKVTRGGVRRAARSGSPAGPGR